MAFEVTLARLVDGTSNAGPPVSGHVLVACAPIRVATSNGYDCVSAPWVTADDDLAPEDVSIIRNALGLLHASKPTQSHYCAQQGGAIRARCDALCDRGLLVGIIESVVDGRKFYSVTEAGAQTLGHELPR